MNITNLFHLDYWFSQPFIARGNSLKLLVGAFLFFIVAGLVCRILSQYKEEKYKKIILKKFGNLGMAVGFLGMVWMFFRQEGVMFLSYRFWLLPVAVYMVWSAYKIYKYMTSRVPQIKEEEDRRARIEKYLPHHKK